jgi:paraquat-inducible protein B
METKMKITKSTLAQIIKEEMAAMNEAVSPDVDRILDKLNLHGIGELINTTINTLPEFIELLNHLITSATKIASAQKLLAIRTALKTASEAPETGDDTQTDTVPVTTPPLSEHRRIKRRRK